MNSETTTPDTPARTALDAHKKWKEMCTNMIFLERQVLRMMAHPDATPEQVLDPDTRSRLRAARSHGQSETNP